MKYFMSINMNNECCTYYLNLRKKPKIFQQIFELIK